MTGKPIEYDVYRCCINFLEKNGWRIICASPPGGTNNRFRKCLLPRRTLGGSEKGPRDEVDLTADRGTEILLVECKPRLSDSLTVLNALGESDFQKLRRIKEVFSPPELSVLLSRGTGLNIAQNPEVNICLAVGTVDTDIPDNIMILKFRHEEIRIFNPSVQVD
jgi:hypothetical protein